MFSSSRGSNINNIIAIILVSRVRHWLHVNIVHTVRDPFDGIKKSSRNGVCIHMLYMCFRDNNVKNTVPN